MLASPNVLLYRGWKASVCAQRWRWELGRWLIVTDLAQPYRYQRTELVEPDWRRFPGWRDVTEADWRSAQWQRAHCVKNLKQLRAVLGDLASEEFYADLERDQAERATMSMLVPPQMINTIVPSVDGKAPAAGAAYTQAVFA